MPRSAAAIRLPAATVRTATTRTTRPERGARAAPPAAMRVSASTASTAPTSANAMLRRRWRLIRAHPDRQRRQSRRASGTPHQPQRGADAIRSRSAISDPAGSAGATSSSTVQAHPQGRRQPVR